MFEARAKRSNIRSSPRKMRLVIDLIRGKSATEALGILKFTPHRASIDAEQTLRSAIANLTYKFEDSKGFDQDSIYVKEVFVNQGPTVKRMLPAPMGRAYRMRKRSNHLTIVVATKK
jgi:large subunit ribosomal protein L22